MPWQKPLAAAQFLGCSRTLADSLMEALLACVARAADDAEFQGCARIVRPLSARRGVRALLALGL
jgi:hypothetical protein